jgi:hypothetical protein
LFPAFPFGTDLTPEEVVLRKALQQLERTFTWKKLRLPGLAEIRKTVVIPDRAEAYLKRMALNQPRTLKEKLLRRAVLYGLAKVDAI